LGIEPSSFWQPQFEKAYMMLGVVNDHCEARLNVALKVVSLRSKRWESDDSCVQIRIASQFIQTVAREMIGTDPDRLELRLEFQARDSQIEAIGMMLLAEFKQENLGGRLYIESLSNVRSLKYPP
jgi:hypothetical protein